MKKQSFLQKKFRLRWWEIALISVAASALGGLASITSSKKEKNLYNKQLKQAPWAPPAWVFGPAWTINNFFIVSALQRILNSDGNERKKLLWLQGFIWFIFFTYGYLYFNKRSTLLAAVWTMSDAVLATASFIIALKHDKKLAYLYLPLITWTGFASTLADYQALKNPDVLLQTKALI